MEAIQAFVRAVFADTTTNVVIALLIILPLLDWVTGVLRAKADPDQTVVAEKLDAFLVTSYAKALNVLIVLVIGRIVTVGAGSALNVPGVDFSILTGGGILLAIPFMVARLASIQSNVAGTDVKRLPPG